VRGRARASPEFAGEAGFPPREGRLACLPARPERGGGTRSGMPEQWFADTHWGVAGTGARRALAPVLQAVYSSTRRATQARSPRSLALCKTLPAPRAGAGLRTSCYREGCGGGLFQPGEIGMYLCLVGKSVASLLRWEWRETPTNFKFAAAMQ